MHTLSKVLLHVISVLKLTYSLWLRSIPVVKGPMDPASLKLKGPQTFVQTVADITKVFVSGCEGILSNDTLMAQLKVTNGIPNFLLWFTSTDVYVPRSSQCRCLTMPQSK